MGYKTDNAYEKTRQGQEKKRIAGLSRWERLKHHLAITPALLIGLAVIVGLIKSLD